MGPEERQRAREAIRQRRQQRGDDGNPGDDERLRRRAPIGEQWKARPDDRQRQAPPGRLPRIREEGERRAP
jgi:hypothetical protein